MIINYNTSSAGHKISRAKFVVEEGEKQNHVAFALVYHLDRLLGVIKRSPLELQYLDSMVTEVVTFDRTQKLQLEYVLLWWLGHISKPSDLHRGFKGHLIHVDADQGFQEPAVDYVRYLNHCQFPNVVYKVLSCFRCGSNMPSKVCFLGQEILL
nr:hypothetical protein BaRGS_025283 [Batillaria attramentaria]